MTDEQVNAYARRIAPERERYLARQNEAEAACAARCAGLVARAARGIRMSGRYWALGAVLAEMAARSATDAETRSLDQTLDDLFAEYTATAERIELEVTHEAERGRC